MKTRHLYILLALIVLSAFVVYIRYLELPYRIKTKGIIYPAKEWKITKTDDGNIINVLLNHYNNTVSHYSVTEFQRGDFAEFLINDSIFYKDKIAKGDTIGYIKSNEEKRRFHELTGELAAQKTLLRVYSTGAKPEDIATAYENMLLAQQEYETQKKITERNRILHNENHISDEEFELIYNSYKTALYKRNIAKSEYESIIAGSKQEQIDYINAKIQKLESQLLQQKKRLNSFTILSPLTGKIIKKQSNEEKENKIIVRMADFSEFIVVLPVEVHQIEYLETGQNVRLKNNIKNETLYAEIIDIDNSVQMINFRQNVFITALIINDEYNHNIIPNMLLEAEIDCGKVPAREYINRLFRTVYHN